MKIDVLTIFPKMFEAVLGESVLGRAQTAGLISLDFIDIRDFSDNKHRRVDDYPFGAEGGMVMTPQPIYNAYAHIIEHLHYKPLTIYLSPQGNRFDQEFAKRLSGESHLVFLCGHYEGVDQRVLDEIVDLEISLGDFVLTGGEIAAMAVIDAVCRMIPDVVTKNNSLRESHSNCLLEYPQYTRPREFRGRCVPEVLFSGNHKQIAKWRENMSLEITRKKRPDLYEKYLNNTIIGGK